MSLHESMFARSQAVTPGGVHSPVRAFRSVGGSPLFFQSGEGPTLTDVAGRKYIDFCLSFGPLILGHRDPDVLDAVRSAIGDGWSFGACEPYSLELAEWIAARVPWVERVRFVSSGTEAVMSAIRVARGATGRPRILKFEGCYHGHSDAVLVKAGSGLAGRVAASSAGVPEGTFADTIVLPLDDDEGLDRVFDEAGDKLAAVIVEPLPANNGLLPQREAWLRHIATRCRAAGALLIFDEVISGFRVGVRGMAGETGITPDLVTFGKVIGGGFPVAAYAGRADLMEMVAPLGPVYQAGTLSANPVGMRAGLATLAKMERTDGWRTLNERTTAFCDGLRAGLAELDCGIEVVQAASLFWFHSRASDGAVIRRIENVPDSQTDWYPPFFHAAVQRGVYLPPSAFEVSFLSAAHDDATLSDAHAALMAAARETRRR